MQMGSGMTAESRQAVGEKLTHLLADTYALYVQTQSCHWNLIGKEFFELHILLEKQYQELAEIVDEIAERIRALGMYVDASLAGFQKICSIKEIRQVMACQEALEHLHGNQEAVMRLARTTGTLADSHKDHATVDLIGRFLGQIEKFAWMIRSQLGR